MVKALNQQEPTESRRLWREVTEERISVFSIRSAENAATSMSVTVYSVGNITVVDNVYETEIYRP